MGWQKTMNVLIWWFVFEASLHYITFNYMEIDSHRSINLQILVIKMLLSTTAYKNDHKHDARKYTRKLTPLALIVMVVSLVHNVIAWPF